MRQTHGFRHFVEKCRVVYNADFPGLSVLTVRGIDATFHDDVESVSPDRGSLVSAYASACHDVVNDIIFGIVFICRLVA